MFLHIRQWMPWRWTGYDGQAANSRNLDRHGFRNISHRGAPESETLSPAKLPQTGQACKQYAGRTEGCCGADELGSMAHSGQMNLPRAQPSCAPSVMTWHQTLGFFIFEYFQLAEPPASTRKETLVTMFLQRPVIEMFAPSA